MQAQELFLCSSVRGILPARDLAGRMLTVGGDTRAMLASMPELHA